MVINLKTVRAKYSLRSLNSHIKAMRILRCQAQVEGKKKLILPTKTQLPLVELEDNRIASQILARLQTRYDNQFCKIFAETMELYC